MDDNWMKSGKSKVPNFYASSWEPDKEALPCSAITSNPLGRQIDCSLMVGSEIIGTIQFIAIHV